MAAMEALPRLSGSGSRRRRLWEFEGFAHCPVIGVCLPFASLRQLVAKLCGVPAVSDDYALHCRAIAECKQRSALAEAVQRVLDQRFAVVLRRTARIKTTEALSAWWEDALHGDDLAGALWATLTHPRCCSELEHRLLGQVHMRQHQVGMSRQVDLSRLEALVKENASLTRELDQARQRSARQAVELARRADEQQSQLMRLRAQLIARDTALMSLRADLQALEAAVPGLKGREQHECEANQQAKRIQALEHALLQAQRACERQTRRIRALAVQPQQQDTVAEPAGLPAALPDSIIGLGERAVLCVGGRPASVPLYRHIVEGTGGRFLHHDGGEEESATRLDATLAAADLVICQTGCISHNAYWRVKEHCKRTGKRCVFVENPGSASLRRALAEFQPEMAVGIKA